MSSVCLQCQRNFTVSEADRALLSAISPIIAGNKESIPDPKLCPDCRQQRRLAFRNERRLYARKCDLTGKQIISSYSLDKQYIVYDQAEWWSDQWDPLTFGRSFDFAKPFFEQFAALQRAVPRVSVINTNSENSVYTNYTANNKNYYLIFSNSYGHNEDCYYGTCLSKCADCIDSINIFNCELCFDCFDCSDCRSLYSCRDCNDCQESLFLSDCRRCRNCIACKGLRDKQYCVQNKQYTKEEYARLLEESRVHTHGGYEGIRKFFDAFDRITPHLFSRQKNCEHCTGDYIQNSRECHQCFDTNGTENSRYLQYSVSDDMNCCDASYLVDSTNCYENQSLVQCTNCHFTDLTWWGVNGVLYSELCFNATHDCFGCIGLRSKQYCILNKQYTKEEYEKLVPKLVKHMRKTGEWGEFFPVPLSPFGYNETIAHEYFPLPESEVEKRGWNWHADEQEQDQYLGPVYDIPDDIADVPDDITKKILRCEVTGKPYKIIPQELKFYRRMGIPIPRKCPDQRHKERLALRNPRKLWSRECCKCKKPIQTSYSPERPEIVYCEECYLKSVY